MMSLRKHIFPHWNSVLLMRWRTDALQDFRVDGVPSVTADSRGHEAAHVWLWVQWSLYETMLFLQQMSLLKRVPFCLISPWNIIPSLVDQGVSLSCVLFVVCTGFGPRILKWWQFCPVLLGHEFSDLNWGMMFLVLCDFLWPPLLCSWEGLVRPKAQKRLCSSSDW